MKELNPILPEKDERLEYLVLARWADLLAAKILRKQPLLWDPSKAPKVPSKWYAERIRESLLKLVREEEPANGET